MQHDPKERAPEDFDVVIKRSLYGMPTCLVLGASRRQCKRWAMAPSAGMAADKSEEMRGPSRCFESSESPCWLCGLRIQMRSTMLKLL